MLKPWYNKIHFKFINTFVKPDVYKFIYHSSLRNDYLGIIIDQPSKCEEFIKEVFLFKDVFFNIQISNLKEYEDLNIPCKYNQDKVHYFCNEMYYKDLKKNIPNLGAYLTKDLNTPRLDTIINYSETIKRAGCSYNTISEYLIANDYTLYLDSEGHVYYNIDFKNKVCNALVDNIEVNLFQFVLDHRKGD